MDDLTDGDRTKEPNPDAAEIAARTAEIRREWTPRQLASRRVIQQKSWRPQLCRSHEDQLH